MDEVSKEIVKVFGNQLRLRVCGICLVNNQMLMIKHTGLGKNGVFWAPPGGGMHLGESAHQTLHREFREETGLEVRVERFLFVNEFIELPLHAIELFFEVSIVGGSLQKGQDPEMQQQSIEEVAFVDIVDICRHSPADVHAAFRGCKSTSDALHLRGYFTHPS